MLVTYPQVAANLGLHGLLVYSIVGALPLLVFAFLGPAIRKHTPQGFVVTEWVRQRFGITAGLMFSTCTLVTLFLYAVAELCSLQSAVTTMTSLNSLPVLLIISVSVGTYASFGGFFVAFFTDNLQTPVFLVLLVVVFVAITKNVDLDYSSIQHSDLLKTNDVSWRLIYILLVALCTNDCFMAGLWIRTFSARSDKDLQIGCWLAAGTAVIICMLVGITGLLAVWTGTLDPNKKSFEHDSADAFYLVLLQCPRWIHGVVLVFVVCISTCALDSLLSAMASTISNDWFRNRVRLGYVKLLVFASLVPVVLVALNAPSVLKILLTSDILSSAVVPVTFLGLSSRFWWLSGFEVVMSLVGGLLSVVLFGTVYLGSLSQGLSLLVLKPGLYNHDWSAVGTFVAAPLGSCIGALLAWLIRAQYLYSKTGNIGAILDRSVVPFDNGFWNSVQQDASRYVEKSYWCSRIKDALFVESSGRYRRLYHASSRTSLLSNRSNLASETEHELHDQ